MKILKYKIILSIALILITSCSGSNVKRMPVEKVIYKPKDVSMLKKVKNDDTNIVRDFLGINEKKSEKKPPKERSLYNVNPYLWKASLNILSSLTSLSEINNESGVITTDWYTSKKQQYVRYKVSALIDGNTLNSDSINVRVYKQSFEKDTWINSPISEKTILAIKNKIIKKALISKKVN